MGIYDLRMMIYEWHLAAIHKDKKIVNLSQFVNRTSQIAPQNIFDRKLPSKKLPP